MPYARFRGSRDVFATGRAVRNMLRYEDESEATVIGEVDALRPGDEEIDQATYDALKATIAAHNAALPEPTRPADEELDALDALLAKADSDVTAAELKVFVLRAMRRMRRTGRLR